PSFKRAKPEDSNESSGFLFLFDVNALSINHYQCDYIKYMKQYCAKFLFCCFRVSFLTCLMLLTGVVQAFADTVSYQFNGPSWTATNNGVTANWHCIKRGVSDLNTSYVKIEGGSIALANSTVSFDNISLVKVYYATTKDGKGRLSVFCVDDSLASLKSGSIIGDSKVVQGPATTTDRYEEFKPSSLCSGYIQIYASCSVNSIYIKSVDIEYSSNSPVLRNSVSTLDFGSVVSGKSKELSFQLSGRNLNSDAVLSVDGEGFSVQPARVSPNEGEISETDVKVTYSPTSVGKHQAKLTISSDGATAKVISLTGTAIAPTVYHTVTWLVNGETYTDGNPSSIVAEGKKVKTLPSAPQAIEDKEFVGWTDSSISGSKNEKPSVLFVDAASAPVVKADVVYYAVFAKKTGNEVTYTKLNSDKFRKDAEYVIGAEDNRKIYYFYKHDENPKWGRMSEDVAQCPPIEFTLSGTKNALKAQAKNGLYLKSTYNDFQMTQEEYTISISEEGLLHNNNKYSPNVTLRFNPDRGLRWYKYGEGNWFPEAYFYEISGGVNYSGYCTSVPRTVSFKAIDSDGTRYATFSSTRDVVFVGDDVEVAGLAVKNDIISPIPVTSASYAVTDASVGKNGEVNGCYVPANTGVLLKSKSDTASYYYAKSSYEVNLSGNMLKPAPVGGANSSPRQVTGIISWPIIITPPSKAWASIGEPRRVAPLR
ncbi:hypothetical protein, partial [Hallella sp.]|uniref:hypothetical protein n=1 Tax=Hallella sp. TaxID=2980186 RepID=UPI00307AB3E5